MSIRSDGRLDAEFDEHLDAELDALLRRTNGSEQEMRSLLETVAFVRAHFHVPQPSPEGHARGKARVLAAVAAQRRAATARPSLRAQIDKWLAGNPGHRLALAGVLAIVFLLIGNGVISLSADSLPGDPLYSLKRAQESVRYSLAQDEGLREQLREEFDEARAREVQAVRQKLRIVRTDLTGYLAAINGQSIEINGFALMVPVQVADTRRFQVGDRVIVTVETSGDGTIAVVALDLANPQYPGPVIPAPSETSASVPTETPLPTPSAVGRQTTATRLPASTNTVSARPTTLPLQTPRATATSTPTNPREPQETSGSEPQAPVPTETRAPAGTRPTNTPEPTEKSKPTNTTAPTETRQPTNTPEPTQTPKPTYTSPPTETPNPTHTSEPSESPKATRTPEPSDTPRPSRTP